MNSDYAEFTVVDQVWRVIQPVEDEGETEEEVSSDWKMTKFCPPVVVIIHPTTDPHN